MDAMPLNLARGDVPVAVAAIAGKMMAKEPARRFHTPGEVAQAQAIFQVRQRPGCRLEGGGFPGGEDPSRTDDAEVGTAADSVSYRHQDGPGFPRPESSDGECSARRGRPWPLSRRGRAP